jgi:hypothetical protein
MQKILIIVLIGSLVVNLVAIWGLFHYIKYGGSPLGELKRRLTGSTRQKPPTTPYAEENARLISENASGTRDPLRVVFFGASITRRWDLGRYFPEIHTVNRGVGGQLLPDMLVRFKRDVIDLKPKAVVIKLCSTNIRPWIPAANLKDGMAMMAELAKDNDIIPIIATVIPAGKPEAHIGDFSVVDSLAAYNDWLRKFASEDSLPLIDFAAAIQDENGFLPRDCSADPVHVNEKGYDILAAAAKPVLADVVVSTAAESQVKRPLKD